MPQMVAHHTAGGCNLRPGDLLGTGTLSHAVSASTVIVPYRHSASPAAHNSCSWASCLGTGRTWQGHENCHKVTTVAVHRRRTAAAACWRRRAMAPSRCSWLAAARGRTCVTATPSPCAASARAMATASALASAPASCCLPAAEGAALLWQLMLLRRPSAVGIIVTRCASFAAGVALLQVWLALHSSQQLLLHARAQHRVICPCRALTRLPGDCWMASPVMFGSTLAASAAPSRLPTPGQGTRRSAAAALRSLKSC
jgi:hypothetical protein